VSLVVTAVTLGPPSEASATGTYVAYTCRSQLFLAHDLAPTLAPAGDWDVDVGEPVIDTFGSSCAKGAGPLWLSMDPSSSHPSADFIHLSFHAPPDTELQDYVLWRSVRLGPSYNYRTYEIGRDGQLSSFDECFPSQGCTAKGTSSDPANDANKICGGTICPGKRNDLPGLIASITCAASTPCPATGPGAQYQLHRADIRLVDRVDPVLLTATGSLVGSAKPLTGGQTLSVSGSDRGGGLFEALVTIDGIVQRAVVDNNGGLCQKPFMSAVPCKLGASGDIPIDTTRLPDGLHSLKVRVSDVAGNLSNAWTGEFRTANASCNPEPRVGGMSIQAAIASGTAQPRRVLTTTYGRSQTMSGRLLSANTGPIAGAPLCIAVRDDLANAVARPAGTLTTDGAGAFTATLPPGPSRTIYFVYRVPGGAISTSVRVQVRAPVRLRASRRSLRNRQRVRFRGGLPVRPTRGVLVELQARRGKGWLTFGTTRTRSAGRFAFSYRFTKTFVARRYQFRALVPAQSSYPFIAGGSRPVSVRVRP
jgi:hypothetical protein